MKRTYITLLLAMVAVWASAQGPNSTGTYYQAANGKKAAALKTAMRNIVQTNTEKSYDYLWTAFQTTDKRADGKVWDMYSNITNFTFGTDQAGNFNGENQKYNREHSFPKSWFGGEVMPMYTDLHHMYPTDGYVNNRRDNYPFGETNGETYKSANNFSKLGACTYSGYTGTVFEPADEYKGDFARTYFYMVTRYEENLHDWYTNNSESRATIDGSTYPAFQTWQLNMLLKWSRNDPVSAKEIARNNAVYGIQNNRNPFIDYPGLEEYIWGTKTDVAFSYDNYDGSGSGSGGDDPGDDPDPSIAGTYVLTITPDDFNSSSYAANNNEKTSQAVCTTDASKTYEVKWTSYQVMLQSSKMQWQKGAGYIYNSTDLGTIKEVKVNEFSSGGTFTTYYGTSELPSSSTTVGGGFFKIVTGSSATGNTTAVEITFTIGDPSPFIIEPVWVETPISELTTSDVFVIVGTNSSGSYALPSNATSTPSATPVTIANGKITSEVDNKMKWNISGNANDGYVFYPNGTTSKWLFCNSSNDGVRIGTTNKNLFEIKSGYLYNVAQSRYVGIRNSSDWYCYTSINSDIKNQTFAFYKYALSQVVAVGDTGYATMVAAENLIIPSGVEVFAVQANDTYAHLEPITTGIPKDEAVVVKASEGSYNFIYASGTVPEVANNDLVAAQTDVTANGTQYCLANLSSGIGFYKVGTGITIPAGKAYLVVSNGVKAFYGFEDEDPDGISLTPALSSREGEIYNLAGQRISKMQKGINIVNGKKVLR